MDNIYSYTNRRKSSHLKTLYLPWRHCLPIKNILLRKELRYRSLQRRIWKYNLFIIQQINTNLSSKPVLSSPQLFASDQSCVAVLKTTDVLYFWSIKEHITTGGDVWLIWTGFLILLYIPVITGVSNWKTTWLFQVPREQEYNGAGTRGNGVTTPFSCFALIWVRRCF